MEHSNETVSAPKAPLTTPFSATEAAMARIAYLLSDEPPGTKFHVSVLGGGCSGFQYHYELAVKPEAPGDFVIEHDGAVIVVDEVSLPLLASSVLDYVEDLSNAGFEIRNPNATARCGCGNSFSVAL